MSDLPSKLGTSGNDALKGRRYILKVGPPKANGGEVNSPLQGRKRRWARQSRAPTVGMATAGEIQKRRFRPEGRGRDKSRPYMRRETAGPSLRSGAGLKPGLCN